MSYRRIDLRIEELFLYEAVDSCGGLYNLLSGYAARVPEQATRTHRADGRTLSLLFPCIVTEGS
ncbi:MAG TPA: hypothetical protein VK638_45015 [Edaphobacter sp.]|nr:hypothetical protein [Edaphobacter sp.]